MPSGRLKASAHSCAFSGQPSNSLGRCHILGVTHISSVHVSVSVCGWGTHMERGFSCSVSVLCVGRAWEEGLGVSGVRLGRGHAPIHGTLQGQAQYSWVGLGAGKADYFSLCPPWAVGSCPSRRPALPCTATPVHEDLLDFEWGRDPLDGGDFWGGVMSWVRSSELQAGRLCKMA